MVKKSKKYAETCRKVVCFVLRKYWEIRALVEIDLIQHEFT